MYDTDQDDPSTKGPYYVPWKKTSMDLYKKTLDSEPKAEDLLIKKKYKTMDGYIPGSTVGNVPTKKSDDKKNK